MKMAMAAALMTMACVESPPPEPDAPVHGAGRCDAARAQGLVGRTASGALEAEAKRLSGAARLRVIPEGGVVTMDYSEGRLNLQLDGRKKVVRIYCG
jgi:peptidase inhibitor I78 family protein